MYNDGNIFSWRTDDGAAVTRRAIKLVKRTSTRAIISQRRNMLKLANIEAVALATLCTNGAAALFLHRGGR